MYLRHVLNHSEVKRSWSHSEDEQDLKKKEAVCLQHLLFSDRVSRAQTGLELPIIG